MRSIGDIRDTFIKKDGKWYERHKIKRKIFDGTEPLIVESSINNHRRYAMPFNEGVNNTESLNVLCSHFKGVTRLKLLSNNEISVHKFINILADTFITLEEFKTYLSEQYSAGASVYFDYIAETPLDIECTEEQNEILDELNNARTYKNVTNITTDSKAILSLDYVKDQETQNQKMQNEIDEIKQLLSTTQTSAMLLDNLQKEVESEVE